MNFLDKLIIPSTANHIALLKYMLTLALLIFIPYTSMLLGSLGLSLFFKAFGKKKDNLIYSSFANDVFNKLTLNKWAVLGLGIVPLLSITFSYSQLLYQSRTIATDILILSLGLYALAFVFITLAKSKFSKGKILAFILLFAASFVFSGFSSFVSDTSRWITSNKTTNVLFSLPSVINFVYFIAITGAITGAVVLFFFFMWNGGIENLNKEYSKFVKTFSAALSILSVITIPVVMLFNFIFLPDASFSTSVFTYAIMLLIFTTILCSFLYSIIRDSDAKYAGAVIILIFIVITFNILKDQMSFANGISNRLEFIITKGNEYEQQKKSKVISTTGIDGELIYNQKCASCHKFDQKLVGPPHKDVVPKYKGDVKKLAEFIMNPTKVDAAYPPMPNPGLKKKEANAVADYLIKKIGQ